MLPNPDTFQDDNLNEDIDDLCNRTQVIDKRRIFHFDMINLSTEYSILR